MSRPVELDEEATRTLVVAAVFVVALGADLTAGALSSRQPVPLWLWAGCGGLTALGAGLLLADARSATTVLAAAGTILVVAAAAFGGGLTGFIVLFSVPIVFAAGALGAIAAIAIGRRETHAGAWLQRSAWAGLLSGLIPLPVMLIQAHRTVSADHSAGRVIVDAAGSYRGAGLGDPAIRIRAALGRPAAVARDTQSAIGPATASNVHDGPSSLDIGGRDRFWRYPVASVDVRDGRAHWMQIADSRAATSRGVGVGDSIRRVRAAYGAAADCGNESLGEDYLVPYPYCQVHAARRRWVTFFADPTRAGSPVVAIWLTGQALEGESQGGVR